MMKPKTISRLYGDDVWDVLDDVAEMELFLDYWIGRAKNADKLGIPVGDDETLYRINDDDRALYLTISPLEKGRWLVKEWG